MNPSRPDASTSDSQPPDSTESASRILVVDDHPFNCELLEAVLEPEGYEVEHAFSGRETLEKIDTFHPDLILLDVAMPGMDGFEVARQLRERDDTRLVPIIMITALGEVEHRVRGLESGADDYLAKPVDGSELLARVQSTLRLAYLRQQMDERQKLELVLGDVSDGILIVDAQARVHDASPSARRVIGLEGDIKGRALDELWVGLRDVPRDLAGAVGRGESRDFVLQREVPALFLSVRMRPVRDMEGRSTGAVLAVRDITGETLERKLQQDVLSMVSHKFRTPLTVASLWVKVLLDLECGDINDEQREALTAIRQATGQLGGLLEGVLSYVERSRRLHNLRRSTMTFEEVEIELRSRTTGLLKPNHELEIQRQTEGEVVVDTMLFMESLVELVHNATKFGGEAALKIRVSLRSEDGAQVLEVADNGPGIPPEHLERIFERFYQFEEDFTGQVHGLGLGLPMVKRAIETMGGELGIHSKLQQGTTFTIRI